MMQVAPFVPFVLLVVALLVALMRSPLSPLSPRESAPMGAEAGRSEGRELVGELLELQRGQRYRADLSLPPVASAESVASGVEALGFGWVSVLGSVDGLWQVEATWRQGSVSLPRPAALVRIWALGPDSDPPAPPPSPPPATVRAVALPASSIAGPAVQTLDDKGARDVLRAAWELDHPGEELTPRKEQALIAVARHETYYGQGWKRDSTMVGSNNWGAIHAAKVDKDGNCPPGSTIYKDSRPTKDGQVSYSVCFKVYETPLEGARDLIKHVYRGHVTPEVLDSGDLDALAWAMRQDNYFEGICVAKGPSPYPPCAVFSREMAAAQYATILERHATAYAQRTGQALAVGRSGTLGVVPSTGADGSAVYGPQPPVFLVPPGASAVGGALLLLVVAGVGLAHEKGWI